MYPTVGRVRVGGVIPRKFQEKKRMNVRENFVRDTRAADREITWCGSVREHHCRAPCADCRPATKCPCRCDGLLNLNIENRSPLCSVAGQTVRVCRPLVASRQQTKQHIKQDVCPPWQDLMAFERFVQIEVPRLKIPSRYKFTAVPL